MTFFLIFNLCKKMFSKLQQQNILFASSFFHLIVRYNLFRCNPDAEKMSTIVNLMINDLFIWFNSDSELALVESLKLILETKNFNNALQIRNKLDDSISHIRMNIKWKQHNMNHIETWLYQNQISLNS
jgi:hypothetical protein